MRNFEEAKTELVETDVLVLGGGIAGCCGAIRATESGLDVVLVDKANVGRSGLSPCMSGILTCFDPEKDSDDAVYEERVELSYWLSDQNCLEGMNIESFERIREMESWGVKFQKNPQGELIRKPGVGATYGRNVAMIHGGLQLMLAVRGEVFRRGVRVIERVMITDLLTSDGEIPTGGRVVGAVGFDVRTGKSYIFKAKATIIATGGALAVHVRCVHPHCSGDGRGMAFRVGAEIRNMDLTAHAQRLRDFRGPIGPGSHIFAMEGCHFVNARGERFMEKWGSREATADRALCARAWAVEEREGRGPVYVDATHLSDAAHDRIEKAIPLVVNSLAAIGLSFRKDRIPYTTEMIDCMAGGIRINREGATTIPALYSAGDIADGAFLGASEVLSPGMGAAIFGHRAGKAAAKYAAEIEKPTINEPQVQLLKEQIFAPMKREAGLSHHEVRAHCRSILEKGLVGPFKTERGLREATDIAQEIREREVPRLTAKDYHELTRSLGVGNELLWLELLAKCSLLRTESRGNAYREDYPESDDANWLKWVIARREDDGIKVWAEPIPFEEYRLKPKGWKVGQEGI